MSFELDGVLDAGMYTKEESLEKDYFDYVKDLEQEYKTSLDKLNFNDLKLDEFIPVLVFMKAFSFSESEAINELKKIKNSEEVLFKKCGFDNGVSLFGLRKDESKFLNFQNKLDKLFYFAMIDFSKDTIDKLDAVVLGTVHKNKGELKNYVFANVSTDKDFSDKLNVSRNKIFFGLLKKLSIEL